MIRISRLVSEKMNEEAINFLGVFQLRSLVAKEGARASTPSPKSARNWQALVPVPCGDLATSALVELAPNFGRNCDLVFVRKVREDETKVLVHATAAEERVATSHALRGDAADALCPAWTDLRQSGLVPSSACPEQRRPSRKGS